MADFVAVLKKTVEGLSENTPEVRARVYAKARTTIENKLAAISPPPPAAVADRQRQALEDAIAAVEQLYAPPPVEEADELDSFFVGFDPDAERPPEVGDVATQDGSDGPDEPVVEPEPVERSRTTPTLPKADPLAAAAIPDWNRDRALHSADDEGSNSHAKAQAGHEDDEQADLVALAGDRRPEPSFGTQRKRRFSGGLIAAVVALLLLGGGAYAVWLNQDAFSDLAGFGEADPAEVAEGTDIPDDVAVNSETADAAPLEGEAEPAATAPEEQAEAPAETGQPEQVAAATPAGEPAEEPATTTPPANDPIRKYTQRLQADGSEIDPGPANGGLSIGEGTSVAELTQAAQAEQEPSAPATPDSQAPAPAPTTPAPATAPAAQVAVGQRAIFYQERTSTAAASADSGSIVWSVVQESPGGDAPPENAIRAEVTIPGKELQLRMTIRRNADPTLPASHIMEMIFLTPEGFEGGGIENVVRVALKDTEQATGSPLLGIPARIADGFFLVALSDSPAEIQANLTLMRRQNWIDIPLIYKSGRRALITLEKGIPGERVFEEAMKTWTGTAG